MKRLSIMVASVLMVLGTVSCKKSSDVQSPESKEGMVKTEFSAVSSESKEKTSISGSNILWSSEDQVKIYAGTSTTGNPFTLTDGAGTTSATFDGWIAETATAPYYAVYPPSLAIGIIDDYISYSIPANQEYVESSFATSTVPMVAYSEADKSLAFKNQTGFIKLQLTGEGTIASMTLASASNNICGTFSVSKTDPTAASTAVTGVKKITVTGISGTALDATTPKNVIIAVAPANFATDDITLSMTASDGKVFSTKIGNFTVERSGGEVVEINVEFKEPIGRGTAKRKGDIDVNWVQLWENGPKWAEYNVGATSVGEYGGYYCWGGTIDQDDSSWYCEGEENIQGGSYDTARNLWGDKWQMPTKDDFDKLNANCDVEWETKSDLNGILYTGRGDYSCNSVFFPAAGEFSYGRVGNVGTNIVYRSSIPNGNIQAFTLFNKYVYGTLYRGDGFSVRAILKE